MLLRLQPALPADQIEPILLVCKDLGDRGGFLHSARTPLEPRGFAPAAAHRSRLEDLAGVAAGRVA